MFVVAYGMLLGKLVLGELMNRLQSMKVRWTIIKNGRTEQGKMRIYHETKPQPHLRSHAGRKLARLAFQFCVDTHLRNPHCSQSGTLDIVTPSDLTPNASLLFPSHGERW